MLNEVRWALLTSSVVYASGSCFFSPLLHTSPHYFHFYSEELIFVRFSLGTKGVVGQERALSPIPFMPPFLRGDVVQVVGNVRDIQFTVDRLPRHTLTSRLKSFLVVNAQNIVVLSHLPSLHKHIHVTTHARMHVPQRLADSEQGKGHWWMIFLCLAIWIRKIHFCY